MNPFEPHDLSYASSVSFASFARDQLAGLKVGDSIKLDTADKSLAVVRSTLSLLTKKPDGVKYITKSDINKELWVLRTQ